MFKLTGTVKVINPTQVISEKFSKREFVIETQDQYPQLVMFQATQDKCSLLDNVQVSSQVEVSFNLRGSEWQGKYYVNLQAWKLERTEGSTNSGGSSGSNQGGSFPPPMEPKIDDSFDDGLPF